MDIRSFEPIVKRFPFRASPYFLSLIRSPEDPMWRQVIPDTAEVSDLSGWHDPLAEEALSRVPNLVHRYPNRVLWLVSHECAIHCRFCTRKRRWTDPVPLSDEMLEAGFDYIRKHKEVKDVLLSGGDPLLLSPRRLETILSGLRQIPHLEIIRIGTRAPGASPKIVTKKVAQMLAQYHPIFMNIHFNHPLELTPESRKACAILASSGIPLGSQTVLLRGVNDSAEVLGILFQQLLTVRVRPYYLMQMDLTAGTAHFRTPLSTGMRIIHALRNRISGLAMPHLVVDLPHGKGKIPLSPSYVKDISVDGLIVKDYRGDTCRYPLLPGEGQEFSKWLER